MQAEEGNQREKKTVWILMTMLFDMANILVFKCILDSELDEIHAI